MEFIKSIGHICFDGAELALAPEPMKSFFNFFPLTIFSPFQTDLLLANESAMKAQRQDLEGHLKSAKSALEEKAADHEKAAAKVAELQSSISEVRTRCDKAEAKVVDFEQRNKSLEQRLSGVEKSLEEKVRSIFIPCLWPTDP